MTASHALQAPALPLHHRDPFDRMLIAQAQIEEMTVVSADSMFYKYDISLLWAAKS
ncbi:type II toxin-antitoxin system VapC family toxin [Nostoc sp.]|uniref:type II toxin-antitoxin system VapC family toxin n=1 Tax=Nostoc sp. TaxID=1180 RepID=UPI002FFA15FC